MKYPQQKAEKIKIPIPDGASKDFKKFAKNIETLSNELNELHSRNDSRPKVQQQIKEKTEECFNLNNSCKVIFNDRFHEKYARSFIKQVDHLRLNWGIGRGWEQKLKKRITTNKQPSYYCFYEKKISEDNQIPQINKGKLLWVHKSVLEKEMRALCSEYICPIALGYKLLFGWKNNVDETIMVVDGLFQNQLAIKTTDLGGNDHINPDNFAELLRKVLQYIINRNSVVVRDTKNSLSRDIQNRMNDGWSIERIVKLYISIQDFRDEYGEAEAKEHYSNSLNNMSPEVLKMILTDQEGNIELTARRTYQRKKFRNKYYPWSN